jgi:hypothetical protein
VSPLSFPVPSLRQVLVFNELLSSERGDTTLVHLSYRRDYNKGEDNCQHLIRPAIVRKLVKPDRLYER